MRKVNHIVIRYHVVRELIANGVISIEHVETAENVADIFTKALGRVKFEKFAHMLLGYTEVQTPAKRVETIESQTGDYV